jgi:hypothetical protein
VSTLTPEQTQAIIQRLAGQTNIPSGLGDEREACSVAAINLALTGQMTDSVPPCMSEVIGKWIIATQDAMPATLRNSPEWRALLPQAAGTGRDPAAERRRLDVILTHMWEVALPLVQPTADKCGFGSEWQAMCRLCTPAAAWAAAEQAAVAAEAWSKLDPVGMLRKLVTV